VKRTACIFIATVFCLVLFVPVSASAQTYSLGETDIHISLDDTVWYVFTRDNIQDNAELEELGLTYEAMYDILHNNDAYMDAILFYEDGGALELFVRKKALDSGIANLSNYDDSDVLDLAEELAERQAAPTYSVYENQYKFAKLEYFDGNYGYFLCEYVTVVNKENYTLTFQSTAPFTDGQYAEIKNIVDSVRFDVDPSLKDEKPDSIGERVLKGTIGGALIGGVSGGIASLITKKIKKKKAVQ